MGVNEIFVALADPTRLAIIEGLANSGPQDVATIKAPYAMSAPAISQHLKILRDANLVEVEKQAQKRIYRIHQDWIDELGHWCENCGRIRNNQDANNEAPKAGALGAFLRARAGES